MTEINQSNRTPGAENRAPTSTHTSVGSTVATSMSCSSGKLFSVESTILNTLDMVCPRSENFSSSSRSIVESFIWCFCARRSSRKELFSEKEFRRFVNSIRKTALVIRSHQTDDHREQSFCKFWIDSYLAQVFHDDERPPREAWMTGSLFVGWCKRFIARAVAKRDFSFLFSLQKGSKQMWTALSEINVRRAIQKSKQRLCSPRGSSRMSDDITFGVKRMARRVFGHMSAKVAGQRFMPSGSACLQASIKNGGALGLFEPFAPTVYPGLSKLQSLNLSLNKWRQDTWTQAFEHCTQQMFSGEDDWASLFDTRFVSIFEPGKIRNISLHDGYLATALQPLQGEMLDAWKHTKWSTMLLPDLTKRIQTMDVNVHEEFWCSGDYEAATDLLFRAATLAAFSGVPNDHPLYELAYNSLAMGEMIYPDEESLKFYDRSGKFIGEKLPMFEGQLMGHTLSFPLLCVINLAVLRLSLDRWVAQQPMKTRASFRRRAEVIFDNAFVNGDDILFKGSLELINIFKQTSSEVGFKVSQGKNYISSDTCMINSQLFSRRSGVMRRFGYLNLRLVKGSNIKSSLRTGDRPVTPTQIGKDLGQMVRLCPWSLCAVPTAFKRWQKETNSFRWFTPNWYLPVSLGGYGFPIEFAPSTLRVTRAQRIVAAMFVNDSALTLFRTTGFSLESTLRSKAMLNPLRVSGEYVPNSHEVIIYDDDFRDPWLERVAYATRAMRAERQSRGLDLECLVRVVRLRRDFRLKPMSAEGLLRHWTDLLIAVRTPPCPPLLALRV